MSCPYKKSGKPRGLPTLSTTYYLLFFSRIMRAASEDRPHRSEDATEVSNLFRQFYQLVFVSIVEIMAGQKENLVFFGKRL